MDKKTGSGAGHIIVVTGAGYEASSEILDYLTGKRNSRSDIQLFHDCVPGEFLRLRKTLKFMSKQDRLALAAAGKALLSSGVQGDDLKFRCGVFMTVGYIPFKHEEANELCRCSMEDNRFSMEKFSTEGFQAINPILAFNCLPNMPAHHLSANFDLQGEYFLTYPGTPQFYLALQESVERLCERSLDFALVGSVADQNNFLVENHFRKLNPYGETLAADAAAFIVLEREKTAIARNQKPLARLSSLDLHFEPASTGTSENNADNIYFGAADLPLKFSIALQNQNKCFEHIHQSGNNFSKSRWDLI